MSDIKVDVQSAIKINSKKFNFSLWAHMIFDHIGINTSNIELLIVNDKDGEYYNTVFRKRPGSTNVLSFPDDDNGGLIILCDPVIIKESHELNKTIVERYFQVYCHGILHLCGYTHDIDEDARVMEEIEDNLFEIFKKNES